MSQKPAAVQADSRIEPRFPATAVPTITSMRLSPGDTAELVNISRSGVLVEGRTRFVPGYAHHRSFRRRLLSRPDEGQGRPLPRVVDQRRCIALSVGDSVRQSARQQSGRDGRGSVRAAQPAWRSQHRAGGQCRGSRCGCACPAPRRQPLVIPRPAISSRRTADGNRGCSRRRTRRSASAAPRRTGNCDSSSTGPQRHSGRRW